MLAFDLDAGWFVLQVDAGGGLVDFLAAMSGATDEFLNEILIEDAEFLHANAEFRFFGCAEHFLGDPFVGIRGGPWSLH